MAGNSRLSSAVLLRKFALKVWNFITLHNNNFFKNISLKILLSTRHGTTNTLPVTKKPLISSRTSYLDPCLLKKKISRHHRIFLSRVVFLWWRNRSDFSNSLKGKVWIVHCQIKSRWAATQHLTNEIQIAVWSCAMNLPSGIFLYEPNYSIWTFSQAKISAGSCGFNGCWLLYKRLLLGHVLY